MFVISTVLRKGCQRKSHLPRTASPRIQGCGPKGIPVSPVPLFPFKTPWPVDCPGGVKTSSARWFCTCSAFSQEKVSVPCGRQGTEPLQTCDPELSPDEEYGEDCGDKLPQAIHTPHTSKYLGFVLSDCKLFQIPGCSHQHETGPHNKKDQYLLKGERSFSVSRPLFLWSFYDTVVAPGVFNCVFGGVFLDATGKQQFLILG